jgi:hypothetical protein
MYLIDGRLRLNIQFLRVEGRLRVALKGEVRGEDMPHVLRYRPRTRKTSSIT